MLIAEIGCCVHPEQNPNQCRLSMHLYWLPGFLLLPVLLAHAKDQVAKSWTMGSAKDGLSAFAGA
jgi:hypothetical protein